MLSIHLGAHKTASTHLQNSLREVQDSLNGGGVFYADPSVLRETIPLAQALAQGSDCQAHQDCVRQFAAARDHYERLFISEENILGGTHRTNMFSRRGVLYPDAAPRVRQVIEMAGGESATLYLSVRDPAHFCVSAFALQMSLGNELELRPYLRGRDPAQIRWSGLVKRLARVEGVKRLVIWRYEDYRAVRERLLGLLLPDGLAGIVPDLEPKNVSVTQEGYEWFLARAMADTSADLRHLLRQARRRFTREDGHGPLRLLDDEVYRRSAEFYAQEIAAIKARRNVEFLEP
ncbi:hypothetical protein RGQ15_02465 [Paracoccus sp. MBLB3053]|uniref:Sulfotransferase family protein n=1 Tax=Paracoccus aurantius TaxID=3073814 RepID=A0ABU2HN26_9RHOB|nr:hypothetical protein [Paracoccus sp. MBLB3053]MDS9466439.1 hypothetical protein [Paracoccus sp. MBLB3053]